MRRGAIKTVMAVTLATILLCALALQWVGYLGGVPLLVHTPAAYRAGRGGPVAVLLSGDMGFRVGMGPAIASRLMRDGVPVVGVNSLAYFRTTRTPAQATVLLQDAIRRARAIDPAARLILIGQSFGADMMHVALANLPPAQRRPIAMVALIVPGATVQFRASPGEIFTFAAASADALPTARRLDWAPLLCVQGREEAASLCPLLRQPNLHAVALPGGHPLRHDADALYHVLSTMMRRLRLIGA